MSLLEVFPSPPATALPTKPLTARPEARIKAPHLPGDDDVLTPDALRFVADLARMFADRLRDLLARRREVQAKLDAGERLDFLPETREVREASWTIAEVPGDLTDRCVEITGPVDRKMIINALNSGANVFMADFEDATSPTWRNLISGQKNLRDAIAGRIDYIDAETGKAYAIGARPATLMVRPRGLHLIEKHVEVDGRPIPGSLFDFGLFFFHNARALIAKGTGPYFYLPKIESHLEARLWNDVFVEAQRALNVPRGTIKATVLIETLPAAFEMDEILYELRDHSAGLNCGRWDYIFSFIKKLRSDASCVLPDRGQVTMEQPFLRAYTQLLVRTCHRRGAHAMGGMAAQIPIKSDPEANRIALDKVRADKLREVKDGHDGTWVAHPALVAVAREVFDAHRAGPNQLHIKRDDVRVTAADLQTPPLGTRTEAGLRHNIRVGVQYIEAWLRGLGCVPLYHLMEDAATAEISRAQVWQWVRHEARLEGGEAVTPDLVRRATSEEMDALRAALGPARYDSGRFDDARRLFEDLAIDSELADFLTLPAYEVLTSGPPEERTPA
jgi:malate synthase